MINPTTWEKQESFHMEIVSITSNYVWILHTGEI